MYAEVTDITDSAVRVDADLLARAENLVNIEIEKLGFDASLISETNSFLKELTVLMACKIACLEQANSDQSPLITKYERYKMELEAMLLKMSNQALGITDPSAPVGGVFISLI